jgi:hypothetical protein
VDIKGFRIKGKLIKPDCSHIILIKNRIGILMLIIRKITNGIRIYINGLKTDIIGLIIILYAFDIVNNGSVLFKNLK